MINIDDRLIEQFDEQELFLMLHISKFVNSTSGLAWPSIKTLSFRTRWSKNTLLAVRNRLEAKGAITVEHRVGANGSQTSNAVKICIKGLSTFVDFASSKAGFEDEIKPSASSDFEQGGSSKNEQGVVQNLNGGSSNFEPELLDNRTINKSIVGKPDDAGKLTQIVVGAITLLNDLTKSGFKPSSKKTRDTIKARVNDGYSLADLEEVIRHKVASWLHDPKQSQYLRPETLFGSKFEGYLQCAKRANQINAIEGLIDIELTEEQGKLYLDYYQYIRDRYPKMFTTTRIVPASEYFAIRPGGKRHRGLSIKWSPGELKSIFNRAHEEAAQLVESGKQCSAVIEVLNQKLNK